MALKCSVCGKFLARGTAHDHDRDRQPDARHHNPHPPTDGGSLEDENPTIVPPRRRRSPMAARGSPGGGPGDTRPGLPSGPPSSDRPGHGAPEPEPEPEPEDNTHDRPTSPGGGPGDTRPGLPATNPDRPGHRPPPDDDDDEPEPDHDDDGLDSGIDRPKPKPRPEPRPEPEPEPLGLLSPQPFPGFDDYQDPGEQEGAPWQSWQHSQPTAITPQAPMLDYEEFGSGFGAYTEPALPDAGLDDYATYEQPASDEAEYWSDGGYSWLGPGGDADDNPISSWMSHIPDSQNQPSPWYMRDADTETLYEPPSHLAKWYQPELTTEPVQAEGLWTPRLSPFWQGADDSLAEVFTFGQGITKTHDRDKLTAEYWQMAAQGLIPGVDPAEFVASGRSAADLPGFSQFMDRATASTPSGLDLAAVTAADIIIPGMGTLRTWEDSDWKGRAFSLGLDAAGFVPGVGLFGKGIRAGKGFAGTAKEVVTTLGAAPFQAARHPIRVAKSTGQLADVILNPRTIPQSALESTRTTMCLPVGAFAGYGFTDDLADVARPGVTMFDDEAAKVAKAASDDLTAMQIAGDAPSVQYGDLHIATTPAPFQKTTGPAMFSTGPDITPWVTGESRDFVSAEGRSFFAPSYLSRFDARSAFGRQTPPGGQAGAIVIRDPAVIEDVLRQTDDLDAAARLTDDAASGKTFTPRGPATEVAEFEATLPQPYQKFRDVD